MQNLEGDKDHEFKELTPLEQENVKLRREIDNMKEK